MGVYQTLARIAEHQDGYFSAQQAKEVGVSRQALQYQKQDGLLRSVWRGIYHLVSFPFSNLEELIAIWLATDMEAVVSHETALALHQLSDALPSRASVTLPPAWKKRRVQLPFGPILYYAEILEDDLEWRGCLRITRPAKTIADCQSAGTAVYLLEQARAQAHARGLVQSPPPPRNQGEPREPGDIPSKELDNVLDEARCPCCPPKVEGSIAHHFVRNYKLPFYSKQTVGLLRQLQWEMMRSKSQVLQQMSEPTAQKQLSPQIMEGGEPIFEPLTLVNDFTMAKDDVLAGNYKSLTSALEARAEQEGKRLEHWVIENMRQSARAMGQVVFGQGNEHDHILDALEKVEVSFLANGEIRDLALYVHPTSAAKLQELPISPAQMERFENIMRRKWEEWSARQSRRRIR